MVHAFLCLRATLVEWDYSWNMGAVLASCHFWPWWQVGNEYKPITTKPCLLRYDFWFLFNWPIVWQLLWDPQTPPVQRWTFGNCWKTSFYRPDAYCPSWHPTDRSAHTAINSWRPLVSHSSGKIMESPTRFHSERLVCRHLPPSSEEPSVPFQLLCQLDLLSSVTLTLSSAFRLVLSVSVYHGLCKVPLQRISLSVTLISTFIIIIIITFSLSVIVNNIKIYSSLVCKTSKVKTYQMVWQWLISHCCQHCTHWQT